MSRSRKGFNDLIMRKKWTDEELDLFEKGLPDDLIAEMTGRTLNAVSIKRRRFGFSAFNTQHWTTSEQKYFEKNYGKIPVREMAEHLGRSMPAIYKRANEQKLSKNKNKGKQ